MIHPSHMPTLAYDYNRKGRGKLFIQKVSGQRWHVRDEFWVPSEESAPGKRGGSWIKFSNLLGHHFLNIFICLVIITTDVDVLWCEKNSVLMKYFYTFFLL